MLKKLLPCSPSDLFFVNYVELIQTLFGIDSLLSLCQNVNSTPQEQLICVHSYIHYDIRDSPGD